MTGSLELAESMSEDVSSYEQPLAEGADLEQTDRPGLVLRCLGDR